MTTQIDFSEIWSEITTRQEAMEARDQAALILKGKGYSARRSALKNQLKQWAGLGIPDGRSCDVFMITTDAPLEVATSVRDEVILQVHLGYADQKHLAQMMEG